MSNDRSWARSASKTTLTESVCSPRRTFTATEYPCSCFRSRHASASAAAGSYLFPTSFCMSSRSAWLTLASGTPTIDTLATR